MTQSFVPGYGPVIPPPAGGGGGGVTVQDSLGGLVPAATTLSLAAPMVVTPGVPGEAIISGIPKTSYGRIQLAGGTITTPPIPGAAFDASTVVVCSYNGGAWTPANAGIIRGDVFSPNELIFTSTNPADDNVVAWIATTT